MTCLGVAPEDYLATTQKGFTMAVFDILGIPVLGNLFNADFSHLSLFKQGIKIGDINNTVNVFVQIGRTNSMVEGAIKSEQGNSRNDPTLPTLPMPRTDVPERDKTSVSVSEKPPSSMPIAPCAVHTTMVFDDDRIRNFRTLNLGITPLVVLDKAPTNIVLKNYPDLVVRRTKKSAKLISEGKWQIPPWPLPCKPVTEFSSQLVQISPLRKVSQVWDGKHSATLYRAPVGETIVVAGQDCFFSRDIFDGLFLLAVRSHIKNGSIYLREIMMVVMPKI